MPNEKILVIEDEKNILKLLHYNLSKEGYDVLLAETGEQGLELAKLCVPDMITLDLMLPRIDGLEICRLLKQSETTKGIPIMILSAKNSEVDQVVGLELGAADYVTKPFSIKVLLARIKNLIKKPKEASVAQKAVVRQGGFSLDKERMVFSIGRRPVNLTKTEFDIMSFFLEHPGIVISRDRLVTKIWGDGAIVSPISINMHIAKIRRKLGKQNRYLRTVRGTGYKFVEGQT